MIIIVIIMYRRHLNIHTHMHTHTHTNMHMCVLSYFLTLFFNTEWAIRAANYVLSSIQSTLVCQH